MTTLSTALPKAMSTGPVAPPPAPIRPGLRLTDTAASLRAHLHDCRAAQGRWLSASMAAERLHGLIAPRFVSTVALGALLMFAASSWA